MENQTPIAYMEDVKYWEERNGQLQNGCEKKLQTDTFMLVVIHLLYFNLFASL